MKTYVVLAALSGMSFSLMGICAKLASRKAMDAQHLPLLVAVFGGIFFGVLALGKATLGPPVVVILGVAAGFSQYLYLRLLEYATRKGPLSGAWCAASLAFIPVLLYGWCAGLPVKLPHVISMVLAVGCVVTGSRANAGADSGGKAACFCAEVSAWLHRPAAGGAGVQ